MPKRVFLAAPESSAADLGAIDKLLVSLQVATGGALAASDVFVPHLAIGDVGIEVTAERYFTRALQAVQDATVVVALVDGGRTDDGVAFLLGYAFAAGKPILALRTDRRQVPHPLVDACATTTVADVKALATALAAHLA